MGRAGLGITNEINKLGVPAAPDRGTYYKDEFRACPNLPNRPEASNPPGLWWRFLPEYPPESSNPLLDAWLSTNDPTAWIQALGEIEAREAGTTLSQLEARAEAELEADDG